VQATPALPAAVVSLTPRRAVPPKADVSEITGRIRAVNADLRALAEGIGET